MYNVLAFIRARFSGPFFFVNIQFNENDIWVLVIRQSIIIIIYRKFVIVFTPNNVHVHLILGVTNVALWKSWNNGNENDYPNRPFWRWTSLCRVNFYSFCMYFNWNDVRTHNDFHPYDILTLKLLYVFPHTLIIHGIQWFCCLCMFPVVWIPTPRSYHHYNFQH